MTLAETLLDTIEQVVDAKVERALAEDGELPRLDKQWERTKPELVQKLETAIWDHEHRNEEQ